MKGHERVWVTNDSLHNSLTRVESEPPTARQIAVVKGSTYGRACGVNERASLLSWLLARDARTTIYGDAVLMSDITSEQAIPEPLRDRILGHEGPFRIHLGLKDEISWFAQEQVQGCFFQAIQEAVVLYYTSAGNIEHVRIALADEVKLW